MTFDFKKYREMIETIRSDVVVLRAESMERVEACDKMLAKIEEAKQQLDAGEESIAAAQAFGGLVRSVEGLMNRLGHKSGAN